MNKYLTIAQTDLEAAHQDVSPVINWPLQVAGPGGLGAPSKLQWLAPIEGIVGAAGLARGLGAERP